MTNHHPLNRPKGKPKQVKRGWLVDINAAHEVDGRNGPIKVPSVFVEGDLPGVWIYDAGVKGEGQDGFKLCGDPDFLDEFAEAVKLMARDIRRRSGWE